MKYIFICLFLSVALSGCAMELKSNDPVLLALMNKADKINDNIMSTPTEDLRSPSTLLNLTKSLVEIDQAMRIHAWPHIAKGKSELDRPALHYINNKNTGSIKHLLIANGGWFKISKYGKEIDHNAWLIIQHSDQDRILQKRVLLMLCKLIASNETSRSNYALLYDRLSLHESGYQVYGTQLDYSKNTKSFNVKPLLDPIMVNTWRAFMGLEPLETYLKKSKDIYNKIENNHLNKGVSTEK